MQTHPAQRCAEGSAFQWIERTSSSKCLLYTRHHIGTHGQAGTWPLWLHYHPLPQTKPADICWYVGLILNFLTLAHSKFWGSLPIQDLRQQPQLGSRNKVSGTKSPPEKNGKDSTRLASHAPARTHTHKLDKNMIWIWYVMYVGVHSARKTTA